MYDDVLSVFRGLYDQAGRDISDCETKLRAASQVRDYLAGFFEGPAAAYLAGMPIPEQVNGTAAPEFLISGLDDGNLGDGFFHEMKRLLPELRAAGGHQNRLHLLARASGGKINLADVGDFLLAKRFSQAKDLETLLKNLGTTIKTDPDFVADPHAKRVY